MDAHDFNNTVDPCPCLRLFDVLNEKDTLPKMPSVKQINAYIDAREEAKRLRTRPEQVEGQECIQTMEVTCQSWLSEQSNGNAYTELPYLPYIPLGDRRCIETAGAAEWPASVLDCDLKRAHLVLVIQQEIEREDCNLLRVLQETSEIWDDFLRERALNIIFPIVCLRAQMMNKDENLFRRELENSKMWTANRLREIMPHQDTPEWNDILNRAVRAIRETLPTSLPKTSSTARYILTQALTDLGYSMPPCSPTRGLTLTNLLILDETRNMELLAMPSISAVWSGEALDALPTLIRRNYEWMRQNYPEETPTNRARAGRLSNDDLANDIRKYQAGELSETELCNLEFKRREVELGIKGLSPDEKRSIKKRIASRLKYIENLMKK